MIKWLLRNKHLTWITWKFTLPDRVGTVFALSQTKIEQKDGQSKRERIGDFLWKSNRLYQSQPVFLLLWRIEFSHRGTPQRRAGCNPHQQPLCRLWLETWKHYTMLEGGFVCRRNGATWTRTRTTSSFITSFQCIGIAPLMRRWCTEWIIRLFESREPFIIHTGGPLYSSIHESVLYFEEDK
jgi:hypothetical protein